MSSDLITINNTIASLIQLQGKILRGDNLTEFETSLVDFSRTLEANQPTTYTPPITRKALTRPVQQKKQELPQIESKSGTKVVRIRREKGVVVCGCDEYIGRRCTLGGWSLPQSKWANPFTVKDCGGAEEACSKYEEHIRKNPILISQLKELRGKTLGCWCENAPCHGHVIIRLLDEFHPEKDEENVELSPQSEEKVEGIQGLMQTLQPFPGTFNKIPGMAQLQ